jgi:hypothetical protein
MKEAYYSGNYSRLHSEINSNIVPAIARSNTNGKSYGECSAHLYFLFKELFRRFGKHTRLGLLVRRPDEFVRSALARGFFYPEHPNALEHLKPNPNSTVGKEWDGMLPYEKCLWYWDLVNSHVLSVFEEIPKQYTRVIRMEDINPDSLLDLIEFVGIKGVSHEQVMQLLEKRLNATPGEISNSDDNPWSIRMFFPRIGDWTSTHKVSARRWLSHVAYDLYPELDGLLGKQAL